MKQNAIPSRVDEYVTWFNNCFTFATAKVVVNKKTGIRSVELEYRKT
jgi:hypothetical protein